MERLHEQYIKKAAQTLKSKLGFANIMQVPKLTKVVVNVGVGKISKDAKVLESIISDVAKITGQAPVKTLARKSISGFKVRENQIVGVVVTLRGEKMYSFLDKLINVALPRVRDFQGLPLSGFDGRGNYHVGIREHLVFPEVSAAALDHIFGLEVSIVTNAGADKPAEELLRAFNFPFKNEAK